jgi:hypothetical protein
LAKITVRINGYFLVPFPVKIGKLRKQLCFCKSKTPPPPPSENQMVAPLSR